MKAGTAVCGWRQRALALLMMALLAGCAAAPRQSVVTPALDQPRIYVAGNRYHIGFVFDSYDLEPRMWPEFAAYMQYRYIEVSWADRDFAIAARERYPGFFTELKTVLLQSDAALVISAFDERPDYFIERNRGRREWRSIAVDDAELRELIGFVNRMLRRGPDGRAIAAAPNYYGKGAIFEANGQYSLANLCGDWVNALLAVVDIPPAPPMTLYPASLMRHVRKYSSPYEPEADLRRSRRTAYTR